MQECDLTEAEVEALRATEIEAILVRDWIDEFGAHTLRVWVNRELVYLDAQSRVRLTKTGRALVERLKGKR